MPVTRTPKTTAPPPQPQPPAPVAGSNLRDVTLLSGQTIQVQGDDEVVWFEETRDKYVTETKFTEATDLRDLDRLLLLELVIYRATCHLAAGVDYEGLVAHEDQLRKTIKDYSEQIAKTKLSMGMNKAARDAEANSGNFADYLTNLKARAKLFGVHRESQLGKALALFNELKSVVGTFDRSDEEERAKIGFETETDVLDWVRNVAIPEYDALDEYFQAHVQRYWVRDN